MIQRWFSLALVPIAALVITLAGTQGSAHAEGAIVIRGAGCALLAADGSIFTTNTGHIVLTFSEQGNSKITCTAWQPPGVEDPDAAVIFNYANTGFLCSTGRDLTTQWSETVTPSGRAILRCVFNPSGQ